MVRAMSTQLIGRQIDGIWHTSVVVFNKEIFYGRGIEMTTPDIPSWQPLQVIDMGETALDEQIFEEYLAEMRDHYTADKVCLLLPRLYFNCNSFTNDCIGFLTGGSIPSWIKDLPADFLSTPLGAALRPTIDAMFGNAQRLRPTTNHHGSSILINLLPPTVHLRSRYRPGARARLGLQHALDEHRRRMGNGPIHPSTNPASFRSLLGSHRAVVAMFTSATCPPCRMIEPVFEELARSKGQLQVAFVKVDLGVGMGSMVAREYGVAATPTFGFFLDGKKTHELKGVNAPELRTQVDLLLYQAFPPHPHVSLDLPSISAVSTEPILFAQVPPLTQWRALSAKFQQDQGRLGQEIFPWLKQRYVEKSKAPTSPAVVAAFGRIIAHYTPLSRSLLPAAGAQEARGALTSVLVQTLLHEDRLVRVAAASLAFNVGAWVQKGRVARIKGEEVADGIRADEEDGEWEVELVSAVAEALAGEEESEDAVHRLTATLAFLIRLSPFYEDQLVPLLSVLQWGDLKVRKKEIRALVGEVADRLCSA
ncbi:PPPDE putative peptidase domain-containing protein [Russula vinacea]|nr:PPPDE putative peptidase domain-containing protein [Russula vinacea]